MHENISAAEALKRLKDGNEKYISASANPGNISPEIRRDTCENGQKPYAVVLACSDSRVIPEAIFSSGIGELFVIRVAGNVVSDNQMGSVEYAVSHLGCRLILVLGHDHCGAVDAAIHHAPEGFVASITDEIKSVIGDEKDEYKASCLNAAHAASKIRGCLNESDVEVMSAIYRISSGRVEFIG